MSATAAAPPAPSSRGLRRVRGGLVVGLCVSSNQVLLFTSGDGATQHWMLGALFIFGLVLAGFSLRPGLTLTETEVVVRKYRARHIAWTEVQAVSQERGFGGQKIALWTATERIVLPDISTFLGLGQHLFDR